MISDIEAGIAITPEQIGRDQLDVRVMTAMHQIRREDLVTRYAICSLHRRRKQVLSAAALSAH